VQRIGSEVIADSYMLQDVVVIGGGPAGAATAICLAQRGVRVTIFDIRSRPTWKIGETLAPSAWPLLRALGVENRFMQEGHLRSYGSCSAWGEARIAEKDFIYHPDGCGWQLDRARFELLLLRAAGDAGARVRTERRDRDDTGRLRQ
jgi:2-polyprenyl-6-methoxyphenol hydroxylase-like FAD-dependent oxidoreductase